MKKLKPLIPFVVVIVLLSAFFLWMSSYSQKTTKPPSNVPASSIVTPSSTETSGT